MTIPDPPIQAAIIGASGYVGRELALILATHTHVELCAAFRASADAEAKTLADLHPKLRHITSLPILPTSPEAIAEADPHVVFLATPHKAAHDLAPALLDQGRVVIDLSAAFRLTNLDAFRDAYGFDHQHPDLLASAVYGLPELNRAQLTDANLIAAPGCYATASILAIAPLVRAGLLAPNTTPIIDAVSGVSGAGRGLSERIHFSEVSYQPYNVLRHRHAPEIAEHAGVPVRFVPHLAEWDRGILATVHVDLAASVTADDLANAYTNAYDDEPFVRLRAHEDWPAIAHVRETNFCDLAWTTDHTNHAVITSAIDNLLKGAAGQAVQAMNTRFNLPEPTLGARSIPASLSSASP